MRAIDKSDLCMDFVAINSPLDVYKKQVENSGGHIYILPRTGKRIISYWLGLRKLIKENQYDIVHVHGNSHTTVLDLSAARAAGCVVCMCHAHNTACDHAAVHFLLTPIFNMLCNGRIACGEKAGKFMFGNKTFHVLNNGVDTKRFEFDEKKRLAIRKQLDWGNDTKVIGHVGYFKAVKNHRFIIDVFLDLYRRDCSYRLLLIGDGLLRNEIERRLEKEGLIEAVHFAGNIDNVDEYLNAFDLVLMPSLYEGLPLALIEQQANGLQCVVSDTITQEVDKTGNVTFLPLSQPARVWADTIDSIKAYSERKERSKQAILDIKSAGYSIYEEASTLKKIYREAIELKVERS